MNAIAIPLITTFAAFAITAIATKIALPILARKRAAQTILDIGPSWHKSKEGTPTMGGVSFLICALALMIPLAILLSRQDNARASLALVLAILYAISNGAVGIVDDLTKLIHKENKGLTPWQKLALQSALSAAFVFLLGALNHFSTFVAIPFSSVQINLGLLYYPFLFLFLLWFVNCANLTDGIDGLATSIAGCIGVFFIVCGMLLAKNEVSILGAILAGSGFGFLLFNRNPAKIFMGDTGSLFLGALVVAAACLTGSPLLLILFGGIYVWEGLSVCLQVVWFKCTRGKRLFKMAPFHHHMEKSGWNEKQIVLLFTLITICLSLLALLGVNP